MPFFDSVSEIPFASPLVNADAEVSEVAEVVAVVVVVVAGVVVVEAKEEEAVVEFGINVSSSPRLFSLVSRLSSKTETRFAGF